MGNIPRIQRRKLVSSVVGTPGVDRSGEMIASSVAQAAGKIANTLFDIVQKKQKIVDATEVNNVLTEFEIEYDTATREIYLQLQNDPVQAIRKVNEIGTDLRNKYTGDLITASAKQQFNVFATSTIRNQTESSRKWARDQQTTNVVNNLNSATDMLIAEAGNINSLEELAVINNRLDRSFESAKNVIGKNASKYVKDKKIKAVDNYINGNLAIDPGRILLELEGGVFDDVLSQETINSFKKDASTAFKNQAEVAQLKRMMIMAAGNQSLMKRITARDINVLKDVNTQILDLENSKKALVGAPQEKEILRSIEGQLEFLEFTRETVISQNGIDAVTQTETYSSFLDKIHMLTEENKPKNNLENIRILHTSIVEEYRKGNLQENDMSKLLTSIDSQENEFLAAEEGETDSFLWFWKVRPETPYDAAYLKLQRWREDLDIGLSDDFENKRRMFNFVLDSLDTAKRRGTQITNELAESIAQQAIRQEQRLLNPKFAYVNTGDMINTPLGTRQVKGLNKRGTPVFDFSEQDIKELKRLGYDV